MTKLLKKAYIKRFKKVISFFFLSIILILTFFLSIPLLSNLDQNTHLVSLDPHNKIYLDGNAALAAFPNKSGGGTPGSPYLIQNLEIDAGGVGAALEIRNTNKYLTIRNCTLTNAGSFKAGIYLQNASNVMVRNCTIRNNNDYGIFVNASANVTILDNQVNQNAPGIYVSYTTSLNISENVAVSNFVGGIQVYFCNGSFILSNYITDNFYGIYLTNSPFSTIQNNTILRGLGHKLQIEYSHYTQIINNTIADAGDQGIRIYYDSDNVSIINNTVRNSVDLDMYLTGWTQNCTLRGNRLSDGGGFYGSDETWDIDTSNTYNGKPIYYYTNINDLLPENFTNAGQILLLYVNDSIIADVAIDTAMYGIYFFFSYNNVILNATLVNCSAYGIQLNGATNITIKDCTIERAGTYGIMSFSGNVTLVNNTISQSGDYGIALGGADNIVENNTIYDHPNGNEGCLRLSSATNSIVVGNKFYDSYYGLNLWGADDNWISGNVIYDCFTNIRIENSALNNVLTQNNATGATSAGIFMDDSDWNNITQNNLSNNGQYGIRMTGTSANNLFHLNTIMENGIAQVSYIATGSGNQLDNGSFGNYYSDYRSQHPFADPVGPDNIIWNEPHQIDTLWDNYPLVSPWGLNWTPPPGETYGTIFIDGNAELDAFPNKTGSGTPVAPYIIANHNIDGNATLSCITIRNTNKNLIIRNCTFTNAGYLKAGIYLQNITNIMVHNSTIINNEDYGIYVDSSVNVTILSNNISQNSPGFGIYVNASANVTILDNQVNQNAPGIYVSYTTSLNISENIAVSNSGGGIQVYYCNGSLILSNYITDSTAGIYLTNSPFSIIQNNTILRGFNHKLQIDYSHYAQLINNTIADAGLQGIRIYYDSDNVSIINNTVSNSGDLDIYLAGWTQNCTLRGNKLSDGGGFYGSDETWDIDTSNTYNGKPIYYYTNINGLRPENFTNAGQILLLYVNDSIIADVAIDTAMYGIYFFFSYHNMILNATLVNCSAYGIQLNGATNITIKDCTIERAGTYGIMSFSGNVTLVNNTISQSGDYGIALGGADNIIENNTIYDHPNVNDGCVSLSSATNSIVVGNTFYDSYNGLNLWSADDSWISGNVIYDCFTNIRLENGAQNNVLTQNNATGATSAGIYMDDSDGNNITQNNLSSNGQYGIRITGTSANNLIHLNTIMENGVAQASYIATGSGNQFDNGSLGNYYSDYRILYPFASHDGTIWDQSYQIDTLWDTKPLVSPWGLNWTAQPPVLDSILPNPSKNGIINLNWSCVGNVTKFYVYRNTSLINSVSSLIPIVSVTTYNYTDNITTNGIYYYVIISENDLGNSSISNCENVTVYIMPSVEILSPGNGNQFEEMLSVPLVVNVTDFFQITTVQLYINSTYIDNLTYNGSLYLYDWVSLIGDVGIKTLEIKAYNALGIVNDTEAVWVNITLYIPPPEHADLYNVTTTNSTGSPQENFTRGEQVIYEVTIRGDLGSGSYVVMAHTDDPTLNAYLTYNETVQVQAGIDTVVKFYFDIPTGATVPTGTYKVYLTVWTDWPYNGGICVDYIIETFTVS